MHGRSVTPGLDRRINNKKRDASNHCTVENLVILVTSHYSRVPIKTGIYLDLSIMARVGVIHPQQITHNIVGGI